MYGVSKDKRHPAKPYLAALEGHGFVILVSTKEPHEELGIALDLVEEWRSPASSHRWTATSMETRASPSLGIRSSSLGPGVSRPSASTWTSSVVALMMARLSTRRDSRASFLAAWDSAWSCFVVCVGSWRRPLPLAPSVRLCTGSIRFHVSCLVQSGVDVWTGTTWSTGVPRATPAFLLLSSCFLRRCSM